MFATALLVFREVLEAALVITIVLAATRGLAQRGRYVAAGAVAGLLGACLVAVFAAGLADALEGRGQEVFNASVLLVAVAMLAWHVIWMNRHGSELAAQMRRVGADVESGRRPPFALLLVVALAVLREGSEIVLFLFGVGIGESGRAAMLGGAALGLASGALVGALLYSGLLRIPVRRFFAATNALILLLAAGMSAQAARFLLQADLLPALGQRVWDTSALLSEQSLVGHALKALVGYDARPAGIQVLFYLATLILILLGTRRWAMRPAAPATTAAAPLTSTGPVARA